MKKLLNWLFISPLLLFLIWIACIASEDLREGFINAIHKLFKNIREDIEKEYRKDFEDEQ